MAEPSDRGQLRIPLGGLSPRVVRRWWPRPRPVGPPLAALVGAALAVVGVLLASAEPQVEVRVGDRGYDLGGQVLTEHGGGVYQGRRGGVLVIAWVGDRELAGASAELNGRPITGHCELVVGGDETCRFTVDGRTLTARDRRTAYGWHRRYSDGHTVAIRVVGGHDVPVPFPVGR
ncbi:MAG TPA: hypothetical protein VKY90_21465 [Candidatus Dormibacteraeota bacterium]|nr:hypothetical protein [Candidatus Dormibacteraeota bacterium]